jgi:AraC-like DNA-binding protein
MPRLRLARNPVQVPHAVLGEQVMGWDVLDIALRTGAISLFLAIALVLWRDSGGAFVGRAGTVLSFTAVCYLLVSTPGFAALAGPWGIPLAVGSIGLPVAFWVFASAWFDDDFELKPRHGLSLLLLLALDLARILLLRPFGPGPEQAAYLLFSLLQAGLVLLGLRAAWRGRDADLVEVRRRIRMRLVFGAGAYIAMVILVQILLGGGGAAQPLSAANALGLLLLAFAVLFSVLGARQSALLQAPSAPAEAEEVPAQLLVRLDRLMREERAHRQDGLTIGMLATRMDLPEYRLRRIINGRLGHRNFNAYLNGFRLDEAKQALVDPAQRQVPIITIAMDAGFGSLAAFNRAFRLQTGMTPTAYRQRALST